MATIGETLRQLRDNFKEEITGLRPSIASDEVLAAFDRAEANTLRAIIDGTPAPAEPPKKRTYTRKPKTSALADPKES